MHDDPGLPPVSSLDTATARTIRRSERLLGAMVMILAAAAALSLGSTGYLLVKQISQTQAIDSRVRQDVRSICGFMRIIGTAVVPGAGSALAVSLVASARAAYYGHGCAPALPPPSAELRAKAAHYRVQLPG